VFNETKNGKGTQFDPQIVDILLRLIDEGKLDLNALYQVKKDDD
jgi:energy-coupling factor transport system substrate-specific component